MLSWEWWDLQHPFPHGIFHHLGWEVGGYCKISASQGTSRHVAADPRDSSNGLDTRASSLLLSLSPAPLFSFQQAFPFFLALPSLESFPPLSWLTPPFLFLHLRLPLLSGSVIPTGWLFSL